MLLVENDEAAHFIEDMEENPTSATFTLSTEIQQAFPTLPQLCLSLPIHAAIIICRMGDTCIRADLLLCSQNPATNQP